MDVFKRSLQPKLCDCCTLTHGNTGRENLLSPEASAATADKLTDRWLDVSHRFTRKKAPLLP